MPRGTLLYFLTYKLADHVDALLVYTEWYYFLNYGKKMVAKQYEWLVADLEAADRPENRSKRPWVVLMGHRPMYCSGVQEHWKGNKQINLTTSATV